MAPLISSLICPSVLALKYEREREREREREGEREREIGQQQQRAVASDNSGFWTD